jgi:hypothetical protein
MYKAAFFVFALSVAVVSYGAEPVLDNERVTVWDTTTPLPTPMHFHDKDALVIYEATGALQSTSVDGKKALGEYQFGQIRFSPRDHTHTEVLVRGRGRAVILELK